jgi:hypothetical protein
MCEIHDIIMQGIDAALKKRGYPSIDNLKAGGNESLGGMCGPWLQAGAKSFSHHTLARVIRR